MNSGQKKTTQAFVSNSGQLCMLFFSCLFFFSCNKDAVIPETASPVVQFKAFHLSASKLLLLQGNANHRALAMDWETTPGGTGSYTSYTIEAAVRGTGFEERVELGGTDMLSVSFSVKEFNRRIRKLVNAGNASMIDLRIRAERGHGNAAVFSDAIALEVTPYQPFIEYSDAHTMRIPGNYQNWELPRAPKLVAATETAVYEGYVDFDNAYPQFLMVKSSTQWDPKLTFQNIGANKLGFGGSMFQLQGGAGVYRMKVNMDNNTWSYTKINSWGLNGSAVSADPNAELALVRNNGSVSWSVTGQLNKGSFRFRANKANDISFGHKTLDEPGVPGYDGESITITKSGNYTVTLELNSAGNYAYSVSKNFNQD